ncbi:MAG: hypothetical protein ACE5FT_05805 [Candidatus Nanoarchaeia archaeon]
MAKYKEKCRRCKKQYVLVSGRSYPICYDCQKGDMKGEITDPTMKKLFDIPMRFYEENSFLRSIKINYLRYGSLTERQVEAFKKAVDKLSDE